MSEFSDDAIKHVLDHSGVGGEKINLVRVGAISGCNLYVDVGGQADPEKSVRLVTAVMTRAFVGRKS